MLNKDIHLVFCIDEHYVQHLAVLIKSIECNHQTSAKLNFHVLQQGIPKAKIDKLRSMPLKGELNLYEINFDAFVGLPIWGHFSESIYSRFLIESIIPQSIDKIIYLDVDMVNLVDIQELWDLPLNGDLLLRASVDTGSNSPHIKEKFGLVKYFNSGILLINLKEWRKRHISSLCIDFIKANKREVECPDQDALNVILKGLWIELDFSWNFHSGHYVLNPLPKDVIVKIVHFAGIYKPWQYVSLDPFRDKYFQYLKLTPWHDFKYSDKTFLNIIKRFIFLYVPSKMIFKIIPFVHGFRVFFNKQFRKFIH